jgi:glycosyltransferase involved in cell wall biosynthesis
VEAARRVRERGAEARFVLVGGEDPANPESIPRRQLESWARSGAVEWWGHRRDMGAVFSSSSIVCLPSYCEGLPKVLIEAAAAGKPIVTTDVPGCREVVRDGHNGLTVPPRDPEALATAITRLLGDSSLRRVMGLRGRDLVERELSVAMVTSQTLAIYDELLVRAGVSPS